MCSPITLTLKFLRCSDTIYECRYKIGDAFFSLPLSEAQGMLSTSTEQVDGEVSALEEKLQELRDEIKGLKAHLYARFGKAINLD